MDEPSRPVASGRVFSARLFGGFELLNPDGSKATPAGRKNRALIAYLILSDPAPAHRERLGWLFWSGRGDDQARASLRQALYELRPLSACETPLIRIDREHISIDATQVATDLTQLHDCSARGDLVAMPALLGDRPGDLLSDLHNIDAGFDEWLADERRHRHSERHSLILRSIERAFNHGQAQIASQLALALLNVDPLDEAATKLAIKAQHLQGDRDAIRRIFARHESAVQSELGMSPSRELVATYQRLLQSPADQAPVRKMTPALPVERGHTEFADGEKSADDLVIGRARPPSLFHRAKFTARMAIPAGLAGVIALTGAGIWLSSSNPPTQRTLLVDPLAVAAEDASAAALRYGLAGDLTRMIVGRGTKLNVIDPDDQSRAVNAKADFVVKGETSTSNGVLRTTVRLLGNGNSTILWSASFSRPASEIDDLKAQIAAKIADVTLCAFGGEHPAPADLGLDATRLYLSACEQAHGDWSEAGRLLKQVVQRKPDFAHAWAMLGASTAITAATTQDYQSARTYAEHALTLDPRDGEGYAALAMAMPGAKNWLKAVSVRTKGLAVEPNNGTLTGGMAVALGQLGYVHDSIVFARRHVVVAPFSWIARGDLVMALANSNQLVEANQDLVDADQFFPNNKFLAMVRFYTDARLGDPLKAMPLLSEPSIFDRLGPNDVAVWIKVLNARATPLPVKIDAAVSAIKARAAEAPDDQLLDYVADLVLLGRVDDAYAIASRMKTPWTDDLFDHFMGPFRSDPRFMTIAAHHGLAQIWLQTNHWPDFCNDRSVTYDCRAEARRALSLIPRSIQST